MGNLEELNRDDWPPLVDEIADVIGEKAALGLFVRFAGRHLCVPVPKNHFPDHIIDQTIGREKAVKLVNVYKGQQLVFPNGRLLLNTIRNRKIVADFNNGVAQHDLATQYNLTSRMICNIINRHRKNLET